MLREMVNYVLSFPALVMNGSLSTWDTASDEIWVPGEWWGSTFCSPGVLGLKQTQKKSQEAFSIK